MSQHWHAGLYPEIPFMVGGVGYRTQRTVVPLLENFINVYLSIGNPYAVHRVIENMVGKFGAERFLFGTGFPDADPMPAVTMLMYAEISDEEKALIGSGNLERLIGGIEK